MQHESAESYATGCERYKREQEQEELMKEINLLKDRENQENKMAKEQIALYKNLLINKTNFGEVEKINSHFNYDEYILKDNKEHFDYFLDKNLDLQEKRIVLQSEDEILIFKGIINGYNEANEKWYININRTSDIEEIKVVRN